MFIKHGHAGEKVSRTYSCWRNMRSRCNNKNTPHYDRYGGRGIKVAKRWDSFENFLADMGECPSNKHSIDRVDVDGNYTKSNCRWVTHAVQMRNTSRNVYCFYKGQKMTVSEAARASGIHKATILQRVQRQGPEGKMLFCKPNEMGWNRK